MPNSGTTEAVSCKPFTRWERAISNEHEIIAPLIAEVIDFGIEPIYPKRMSTTSISVVTAHQFADVFHKDEAFDLPRFATDFLSETNRSALQPVTAPVKNIEFMSTNYGKRSKDVVKAVLTLDCPTIKHELSTANALLNHLPYTSDIHVSFVAFERPQSKSVRKKLRERLSEVATEQMYILPVKQKTVNALGATTFRSLRTLEWENRINRIKRTFASRYGGLFATYPQSQSSIES